MEVGESHPVSGEPVDPGRFEIRIAEATHARIAYVIDENEDKIGLPL
jgi:hypothetical protein